VTQLLKQLFGLLQAVFRLFADRQLLEAGKAQQREAYLQEVQRREEQAEQAVATPDPVRDERLRSRFDRARRSQ
jgi:tRNA A37 threonylcarbamoyladenosine modification protein TsaB